MTLDSKILALQLHTKYNCLMVAFLVHPLSNTWLILNTFLSGVPDYFGPNKISSGGDLSHYSSASLY